MPGAARGSGALLVGPAPGRQDRDLPLRFDLAQDQRWAAGLLEPRPFDSVDPDRPALTDEGSVAGGEHVAQLDLDLGAARYQLGEHGSDVVATVDRRRVLGQEAGIPREAGRGGIEVARAEPLGEGETGPL